MSQLDEPTEAELRAAIGPRADYYVAQWRGTAARSVNWAAVLLSGLWLPFRGLYLPTAIFYAAILAETFLEEIVIWWLGYPEVPRWLERTSGMVPAVVCGTFANRWYLNRLRTMIAATRARALPEEEHLKALSAQGGTRVWHAVGWFLLFIFGLLTVQVALALLGGE